MDMAKVNRAVKIKINLIHMERRFNSTNRQAEKIFDNRKAIRRLVDSMTGEERTEYYKRIA